MPTIDLTRSYADGSILTQADLDAIVDDIETALNTTKIDSNNIQTGGIATANLADLCVSQAKLNTDAVSTTKIVDANVTTAKIADSNITTAKINDSAVTTAKINDSAVTATKLPANVITPAKMASNNNVTATSINVAINATSFSAVTGLNKSITVAAGNGRPIVVQLVGNHGTLPGSIVCSGYNAGAVINFDLQIKRDSTVIGIYRMKFFDPGSGTTQTVGYPAAYTCFDTSESTGTLTYSVEARVGNGSQTMTFENIGLHVYQI